MRRRQRPPPDPPDTVRLGIPEAHRRFVQVLAFVHLSSVVACAAAAGLQARAAVVAEPIDSSAAAAGRRQQLSTPWLPPWPTGPASEPQIPKMSYFWHDDTSPDDICNKTGNSRIAYLNATFLFHEQHPISVWEVFSGGSTSTRSRLRLREGMQGQHCVYGSKNECLLCFSRIRASLKRLDNAFRVFNSTLHRFDCMPAVDTASATRPFSPNGSCEHCKTWYGRWLLVHLLEVWEQPPCINWCYYAQLACPHLATSKVVDYAGHPSFQCRDLHIPAASNDVFFCDCVHPCDVRGAVSIRSGSGAGSLKGNDFFAAKHHCSTRKLHCANTAHDRGKAGLRASSNISGTQESSRSLTVSALLLIVLFALAPPG